MSFSRSSRWICALLCVSSAAGAQQLPDSTARRQQRALDSLATTLRSVQARLDSLTAAGPAAPAPSTPTRTSGAYMNVSFVGITDLGWSTTPNVNALQVGDHDPQVRGFSIPNAELALDGTVDPYFKGFANIVYKLDANGETSVELEEMIFLSTSLPGNLQVKGGQFFAEFGRQNPQHPHSWAFADQPLVLNRMFGPDGLRSQGLRVSWLLPTSFFAEASVTMMNSAGGTTSSFRSDESSAIHGGVPVSRAVDGLRDMLYVPRLATSVDLTDNQVLLVGVSGALGPNSSGPDARTSIFGAGVYWKWKSPRAQQGFPFVSFQSEGLVRRYDAASRLAAADPTFVLPAQALKDRGAYGQLLWGIKPLLVAGLRAEFASGDPSLFPAFDAPERANRDRYSTNLTWFPTEFSKFRLQYNYDHRAMIGNDHSIWMQFEFLLGAHAAHKF